MITNTGGQWVNQEGGRDVMYGVKYETLHQGVKVYSKAEGRVAAQNQMVDEVAMDTLRAKVNGPKDVDLSDLIAASQIDRKHFWRSQNVIDVSQSCV